MRTVFVDTSHFVATLNRKDQWHQHAIAAETALGEVNRVTSELVLIEVLNYFSAYGRDVKVSIARSLRRWLEGVGGETVLHTHAAFLDGLSLYEARIDKGYSLTDAVSMNMMRERGITEILTRDGHFTQESFRILL
jgi:uncharacterized protein